MQDNLDNERSLFSLAEAIQYLSIPPKELFDLAEQEGCSFFIDIPDAVEVCLRGRDTFELRNTISVRQGRGVSNHGPLIPIRQGIRFLGLTPTECLALLRRGRSPKKTFQAVGIMDADGSVTCLDKLDYLESDPDKRYERLGLSESFFTCQTEEAGSNGLGKLHQPMVETSLSIQIDDLSIRAVDLEKIANLSRGAERQYGRFKEQNWASPMLLHLNEASTFFFSKPQSADRSRIEDWFRAKWSYRKPSGELIEQAVFAILPDDRYRDGPPRSLISSELLNNYNDYASTALIIINEYAKLCWEERTSSTTEKPALKWVSTAPDLEENGLTVRLARAASTIIRLNK